MEINFTIVGQIITFAILVWFTMKFVWPPINNMLEERARKIADGLAAAEKGKSELLEAEAKAVEELKHVQLRAMEIMSNAEKRANQIISEAKENAVKESLKILDDAKVQIEQEFLKAKEELRLKVAELAIIGAEQILKTEINRDRHEAILASLKAEL
ncbi:MAG: F0F1 ATP synthase subunit B [Burkholderiales bacterium]|nr:F0F1 ATP synthase subunit B [Burkholderiales bacterium]